MRALAAALLVVLAAARIAAAGDPGDAMQRVGSWFKLADHTLGAWTFSIPDPQDALRVEVRRRGAASQPSTRIMVIYPRKSSAYDVAMSTLLDDFAARDLDVVVTAANFANDPARGETLVREAVARRYALVYAMGSETVAWLHAQHRDLPVPIVTICAKDPVQLGQMADYTQGSGTSMAFTSLNVLLDVQLAYLRELKPELRNIGILVDSKNVSAVETQAKPLAAAARTLGIEAFEVTVDDPHRAAEQLAERVPAAVARMRGTDPTLQRSVFWITGSTSVFTEITTINAHAATVPVLSVVPEVVQAGSDSAVLSIGVSFVSNAQLAAFYGVEILSGRASAGDLPVGVVSPPDIAISFLHARRIGLRIPFSFLEVATFVYDGDGRPVREHGRDVSRPVIGELRDGYSPAGVARLAASASERGSAAMRSSQRWR